MVLFGFNGDEKIDAFEFFAGMQMCASSRKEAIEFTMALWQQRNLKKQGRSLRYI